LHEFDSLQEVQETLETLASYEVPFVKLLPKKAGQKEARYFHCFAPEPENFETETSSTNSLSNHEERIAKLEQDLAELKAAFDDLMRQLS
jgi:uncharacterized protein YceH (UPF0502 family)